MISNMRKIIRKIYYFFLRLKQNFRNYIDRKNNKHPITPKPTLAMTLLVKNEISVIETNIMVHRALGVNYILVTDNNSNDGTYELLQKLKKEGYINELVLDEEPSYNQAEKVDRMIRLAINKYKADWVFNVDADEIWYSKTGDLKNEISDSRCNVIKCPMKNVYPDDTEIFESKYIVKKNINEPKRYNMRDYNLYSKQFDKVIHRTAEYSFISMGNHDVEIGHRAVIRSKDITIYHYCIRSKEHFKEKMVNGAIAAMKAVEDSEKVAVHWKYFYDLLVVKGENAEEEYKKYIGQEYFSNFLKKGVLVKIEDVPVFISEIRRKYNIE